LSNTFGGDAAAGDAGRYAAKDAVLMKVKILLTNGKKFIDVFWLLHDGSDIYCGPSSIDSKRSYHASGKVHSRFSGKLYNEKKHIPLANFSGEFLLEGLGIGNLPLWFEQTEGFSEFSGKKTDIFLVIDLRTVPSDVTINIRIGLLEPWRTDLLISQVNNLEVQQMLIATAVRPWIYTVVHWARAA
jgi:hypothetical protein